ncbi:MAG: glycosyltransferase family 2 protein [Anaerolineae bacterium]
MIVSVVIPAYNEGEIIGVILEQLIVLKEINEIIVVDDGSTDNTADIIRNFSDTRVHLQQHPYNIGNGAAVKTGIRAAKGDVIIMMDADGQHPPEEIPEMLLEMDKYAMVVGARGKGTTSAWHRDLANRMFNAYASYLVGYKIPDLTSGFRIIRANIVKSFLYLLPNGYSYPTTITVSLFRSGFPVKYHSFASPARVGTSKIKPLRDGLRFLMILTRLGVFFVPLKVFVPLSLFLFIPGVVYTLLQIIVNRQFSGFGGLVTTLGVFIMLLGLIAEQIATLRYVNVGNTK